MQVVFNGSKSWTTAGVLWLLLSCPGPSEGKPVGEGVGDASEGEGDSDPAEGEGEPGPPGPSTSIDTQADMDALRGSEIEYEVIVVGGSVTNLAPLAAVRYQTLIIGNARDLISAEIVFQRYPTWTRAVEILFADNDALTSVTIAGPMIYAYPESDYFLATTDVLFFGNLQLNNIHISGFPKMNGFSGELSSDPCNITTADVIWVDNLDYGIRRNSCIPADQLAVLEALAGPTPGPAYEEWLQLQGAGEGEGEGEPSDGQ